jgi:hypothetical protein
VIDAEGTRPVEMFSTPVREIPVPAAEASPAVTSADAEDPIPSRAPTTATTRTTVMTGMNCSPSR